MHFKKKKKKSSSYHLCSDNCLFGWFFFFFSHFRQNGFMFSHRGFRSTFGPVVISSLFSLLGFCVGLFFPSCSFFILGGTWGDKRCSDLGSATLEVPKNGYILGEKKTSFSLWERKTVKTQLVFLQRPPLKCCQGKRDLNYFNLL